MRVSYSKKHRKDAREQKQGLFTIAYVEPDGCSVSLQGLAPPETLKEIKEIMSKHIRAGNNN